MGCVVLGGFFRGFWRFLGSRYVIEDFGWVLGILGYFGVFCVLLGNFGWCVVLLVLWCGARLVWFWCFGVLVDWVGVLGGVWVGFWPVIYLVFCYVFGGLFVVGLVWGWLVWVWLVTCIVLCLSGFWVCFCFGF